jgi:hypothetical protein
VTTNAVFIVFVEWLRVVEAVHGGSSQGVPLFTPAFIGEWRNILEPVRSDGFNGSRLPLAVGLQPKACASPEKELVLLSPALAKDRQRDGKSWKRGEEGRHLPKARTPGQRQFAPVLEGWAARQAALVA